MVKSMEIGGKRFDIGNHSYIMGILNMTPDSFSDGGSYPTEDAALYQVERMLKEVQISLMWAVNRHVRVMLRLVMQRKWKELCR